MGSERGVEGGRVFKHATVPRALAQSGPSVDEETRHKSGFGTRRKKKDADLN